MRPRWILLLLTLFAWVLNKTSSDILSVDPFVSSIGYATVNEEAGLNLFYWLTYPQNVSSDKPLIIWLHGGVGCSALVSLFFDVGPYRISNSPPYEIEPNVQSIGSRYPLLFLEYTSSNGFSFIQNPFQPIDPDNTAVQNVRQAIHLFMTSHPGHQERDIYLFGEYCAARLLPSLASLIMEETVDGNTTTAGLLPVNLRGIGLGSPALDVEPLLKTSSNFSYNMAFVDQQQFRRLGNLTTQATELLQLGQLDGALDVLKSYYAFVSSASGQVNIYDVQSFAPFDFSRLDDFLGRASVHAALHTGEVAFKRCDMTAHVKCPKWFFNGSTAALQQLAIRGVKLLTYGAQWDLTSPPAALEELLLPLSYNISKQIWVDEVNVTRGLLKQFLNVTQILFVRSGRMLAANQSDGFFEMVVNFVEEQPFRINPNPAGAQTSYKFELDMHRMRLRRRQCRPPLSIRQNRPFSASESEPASAGPARAKDGGDDVDVALGWNRYDAVLGDILRQSADNSSAPLLLSDLTLHDGPNSIAARTCVQDLPRSVNASDFILTNASSNAQCRSGSSAAFANSVNDTNFFFWFFESQDGNTSSPVILWLQGGPACSSMYGAFYENGPVFFDENGALQANPFAWNANYGLIFVDFPVGVGFSYTTSPMGPIQVNTDESIGSPSTESVVELLYPALLQLYSKFPGLQSRPLYLFGESYGAKWVLSLGHRLLQGAHLCADPTADGCSASGPCGGPNGTDCAHIPLSGVAYGNGWAIPLRQSVGYAEFAFALGLVDQREREELTNIEADILANIQIGNFTNAGRLSNLQENLAWAYGGFPNTYDTRLPLNYEDSVLTAYLNDPAVERALHTGSLEYEECNNDLYDAFDQDEMRSLDYALDDLLQSGVRVMIYNGQFDSICPAVLAAGMANGANWPGEQQFANATRHVWTLKGQTAAYITQYSNLTLAVVVQSGHIAPMDQPERLQSLVSAFITQNNFSVSAVDLGIHILPPSSVSTRMKAVWIAIGVVGFVAFLAVVGSMVVRHMRRKRRRRPDRSVFTAVGVEEGREQGTIDGTQLMDEEDSDFDI